MFDLMKKQKYYSFIQQDLHFLFINISSGIFFTQIHIQFNDI